LQRINTGLRSDAISSAVRAAEADSAEGMLHLRLALVEGRGVVKDVAEGISWLKRAAQAGNENAQKLLKQNAIAW
jgi:TPR repeat protein